MHVVERQDDFYLNLVDWSSTNVLAVGLGSSVYLWSACTSKVTRLLDLGADDCVTSVAWTQRVSTILAVLLRCRLLSSVVVCCRLLSSVVVCCRLLSLLSLLSLSLQLLRCSCGHRGDYHGTKGAEPMRPASGDGAQGTHISIGTNAGTVQVWDATKCQRVRTMSGHTARVGTMAWNTNTLASGGRCVSVALSRSCNAADPILSLYARRVRDPVRCCYCVRVSE